MPVAKTAPVILFDQSHGQRFLIEEDRPLDLSGLAGKAGKGDFVVFGDDAIFQNRFLNNDNLKLAENLAQWFVGDAGGELI